MASSVDLPQPEGPAIDMYSPSEFQMNPGERVRLHLIRHETFVTPSR